MSEVPLYMYVSSSPWGGVSQPRGGAGDGGGLRATDSTLLASVCTRTAPRCGYLVAFRRTLGGMGGGVPGLRKAQPIATRCRSGEVFAYGGSIQNLKDLKLPWLFGSTP